MPAATTQEPPIARFSHDQGVCCPTSSSSSLLSVRNGISSFRVRSSPSARAIVPRRLTEFSLRATSSFFNSSLQDSDCRSCQAHGCSQQGSCLGAAELGEAGQRVIITSKSAHMRTAIGYNDSWFSSIISGAISCWQQGLSGSLMFSRGRASAFHRVSTARRT